MSSNDAISTSLTPPSHNVKKDYIRMRDEHLIPPAAGNNWNDPAFQDYHHKTQQLVGEGLGMRKFVTLAEFNPSPVPNIGLTARQLMEELWKKQQSHLQRPYDPVANANPGGLADLFGRCSQWSNAKEEEKRLLTLDDKVLRFYAFFRERAPEGGANDWWTRRVRIYFYPEDESIAIDEPVVANSGRKGGRLLVRQKVPADPRQREQFPCDEFVSLNFFNVGKSVRIFGCEYFIYDCDGFTRDFFQALGIPMGCPLQAPYDDFPSSYRDYQEKLAFGSFGTRSSDYHADAAERAAHFLKDSGKLLKFYGLMDERGLVPGGALRLMELLLFVEDGTMSVLERQYLAESNPGLFLSRCWLPKSGSMAKVNELTFAHRVNGMREPYMGPDAYYKATDLDVGKTINALGRSIYLYDCDDFTRVFMLERHGIQIKPPIDISEVLLQEKGPKYPRRGVTSGVEKVHRDDYNSFGVRQTGAPKDELRFLLQFAYPRNRDEEGRRFTLRWYTDTDEGSVHESVVPNSGFTGGLFRRRARLPKPPPPNYPRNAPERRVLRGEAGGFYCFEDIREGREIYVNGIMMKITGMDLHTKNYLDGARDGSTVDEIQIRYLLSELQEFLGSRYGTGVQAFLAFDHDKDGVISLMEFTNALKSFQITANPYAARALFYCIAPVRDTGYLTPEDVLKWLSGIKADDQLHRHGLGGVPIVEALGRTDAGYLSEEEAEGKLIAYRTARRSALLHLKSRLEARCIDCRSMFRLASTMPRAYPSVKKCGDILFLTNPDRDTLITPVQLRRGLEEVLGGEQTLEEMGHLLRFFFPTLPNDQLFRPRDDGPDKEVIGVDLCKFHELFNEMVKLTMLQDHLKGGWLQSNVL